MKALLAGESGTLTLERYPTPNSQWLNDGVIRWLNVEGGSRDELAQLFDNLGTKGPIIADCLRGDDWMEWTEHAEFVVKAQAAPSRRTLRLSTTVSFCRSLPQGEKSPGHR
jgi:hypothetical protein